MDKDVVRTDRGHPAFAAEGGPGLRGLRNVLLTHVVYDRDMGYCQVRGSMKARAGAGRRGGVERGGGRGRGVGMGVAFVWRVNPTAQHVHIRRVPLGLSSRKILWWF